MRISHCSSDVCSSDLRRTAPARAWRFASFPADARARLGAHSRGRTRHAQGPLALPRPPATLSRRRRRRPIRVRMTASTGKTVIVATDGACKGNPGPGGWGAVLRWGDVVKTLSGGEPDTTNNRMELMAAIEALRSEKHTSELQSLMRSSH